MRILITGITGFVGSHMVDYLLKNVPGVKVFATRRWRSRDDNIKHFYGDESLEYNETDGWWLQGECLVSVDGVVDYDDDAVALHRILNKKLNGHLLLVLVLENNLVAQTPSIKPASCFLLYS